MKMVKLHRKSGMASPRYDTKIPLMGQRELELLKEALELLRTPNQVFACSKRGGEEG